jgi:hypothetical protein
MPTNRKLRKRTSNRIPTKITDAYFEELRVRDFLGELREEEISLAKELGVFMFDEWMKEEKRKNR